MKTSNTPYVICIDGSKWYDKKAVEEIRKLALKHFSKMLKLLPHFLILLK